MKFNFNDLFHYYICYRIFVCFKPFKFRFSKKVWLLSRQTYNFIRFMWLFLLYVIYQSHYAGYEDEDAIHLIQKNRTRIFQMKTTLHLFQLLEIQLNENIMYLHNDKINIYWIMSSLIFDFIKRSCLKEIEFIFLEQKIACK